MKVFELFLYIIIVSLTSVPLANAIRITPADETVVRPGQDVLVSVVPDPGERIKQVMLGLEELHTSPFEGNFTIAPEEIGPTKIDVLAFYFANGQKRTFKDFIILNIVPSAPLTGLGAGFNSPFLYAGGLVEHIEVTGIFGDGVSRELTKFSELINLIDEYGITFVSSDPETVVVGKLGHIQGLKPGKVLITVNGLGGTKTTVPVDVPSFQDPKSTTNRPPTANAGSDITVPSEATFNLNGSGSSDPDGDVITYQWEQIKGPRAEVITGTDQASVTYKAPKVKQQKILLFTLTVTDSKPEKKLGGADSLPAIVKVTVQP